MTAASAAFFEVDISYSDSLLWSSVGQTTGIGMFAMGTTRMDLVAKFRNIIRMMMHDQ